MSSDTRDLSICAFTFARGGSKGVPRKNVRLLNGKPLLAHAIEHVRGSRYISRHIVSTEDDEIAAVAQAHGAEVPFMRPTDLASDTAPEILSWKHAIRTMKELGQPLDVLVSVPATSPFRTASDIDATIEKLLNTDADLVLTVTPAQHNPYFNMAELDEDDVVRVAMGAVRYARRQDAPVVYEITGGCYATRPDYVLSVDSLFEGKVVALEVPAERALDIDTEQDFRFAEFLVSDQSVRDSAAPSLSP